jgi:hypothetical protein
MATLFTDIPHAPIAEEPPRLTVAQILAWADAYFKAFGRWPGAASGPVAGAPDYTWSSVNTMLREGGRGLPQGASLARLLKQHGRWAWRQRRNGPPALTIAQILSWADAYHEEHGRWPNPSSGPVSCAPAESWRNINQSLWVGGRSLSGGMSLARLLVKQRGAPDLTALPALSVDRILAWADAHHAATGKWPTKGCGAVPDAPGEKWSAIDGALYMGCRGLPGGSTLRRVLNEHRPGRNTLTLETIRAWGEAHHAATGRWPDPRSGAVAGAPAEKWSSIERAVRKGSRGLPGGMTLARLFGGAGPSRSGVRRPLSVDQILAWADAHRAATGRWPVIHSGSVAGAPGETWYNINQALYRGLRGLPSGTSVAKLLAGRR